MHLSSFPAADAGSAILIEWRRFFRDGDQFLHLAQKGMRRREKFSAETLYNLAAMAIEKHLMALFFFHNNLPEGHTLSGLLSHGARFLALEEEEIGLLARMDALQEICALDGGRRSQPKNEELLALIAVAGRLRDQIEKQLPDHPAL